VEHELAQINVARLVAPFEDPLIAEFADALDPINALAEASPGFVWRFQTDEGNATAEHPYEDELVIINMTTWASLEALQDYVYRTDHTSYLRRRREWFERPAEPSLALWWVPTGHRPSVSEGVERLARLRADGAGPEAFTFAHRFAPPAPSA